MTSGQQQHHEHEHTHGHTHGRGRGHGHGHAHGDGGAGEASLAQLLDLDAEVLGASLARLAQWVAGHAGALLSGRVLDLGCGTGAGTFALLRESAEAEVVAVDGSELMLGRLMEKARELGVEERVRTVRADLDEAWPDLGTVNVAWTSAFMHHLARPDEGLRRLFAALRPGGLLALIEVDSFPRFLPAELGDGLEERCHAVVDAWRAQEMPHIGDDWGALLREAGFTVEQERTFDVELGSPVSEAARRYARVSLGRTRERVAEQLSGEDLRMLDALLDDDGPESLLRRDDLAVRAKRVAWAARRP